jgi:hypothetical protein
MKRQNYLSFRASLKKEFIESSRSLYVGVLFLTFIFVTGITDLFAQSPEVIVFAQNWDNTYSTQPWYPNFSSGWFLNSPKNQLVAEDGKGNSLKINFAKDDLHSAAGIGNYRIFLDSLYKELYLSWEYYLPANFDFGYADGNGGGKFFGGLCGGNMFNIPRVDVDTNDGWGMMMLFQNGDAYTYPYLYNAEYWGGYPAGYKLTSIVRGQWRELTLRLKVNDPNKQNGIVEYFDNGKLVFQQTNVQMTSPTHPEWLIDAIYLDHFFGGSSPSPIDQYAMYDNIVAWYYPKNSTMYRSGLSESGRTVNAPRVANYLPQVPNKFTPTTYTDANGVVTSHCGFEIPIVHDDAFETSTIEVSGATYLTIDITEFSPDLGVTYTGYKQKLNIYSGKGTGRTLVKSFENGVYTKVPTQINITGGIATIEWQAGRGTSRGFSLKYSSNGSGSGKNFKCKNCTASQSGTSQIIIPPPNAPSNLLVASKTANSIKIQWTDNASNETGFEIERTSTDSKDVNKTFRIGASVTAYTDAGLQENATYSYRIRAYNSGGYSSYSNTVTVSTSLVVVPPPNAPSALKSTAVTESSITLAWTDNSADESGFIITRRLSTQLDSIVILNVNANTNIFKDSSLTANTSYYYRIQAINAYGKSTSSNKSVASTLSVAETKRFKDGLIAYYNFGYNPDYLIYDLSGYGTPLTLKVQTPSAVQWNNNNRLEVLTGTSIVSTAKANKIVSAVAKTGQITMECWIRPAEPEQSSSSRVISLGINDDEVGFILDQEFLSQGDEKKLNYKIRMQTESTVESGYPEVEPSEAVSYLNLQHIAYVRDSLGNESMFINGNKVAAGFRPSSLSTWSNNFYLRLGNENDLTHPWKGTFYSVAVYNKALSASEIDKNYSLGPCDSIRNNGQDFTLSTYPNPSSGFVYAEITPTQTLDFLPLTYIRVLDIYGKLHYQETIFNPNNQFIKELDFNNFAKGIYFLQIISGSNKKSTKIIIQ